MNKAYQGLYKYIRDDVSNKAVGVEANIEIEMGG